MAELSPSTTVGQLVVDRPSRARIFERHKIDYCCGGKIPLSEACEKRGVDLATILAELEAAEAPTPAEKDWTKATLIDLADHIESVHHAYLRTELPRLSAMAAKVAAVHGANHAELTELSRAFDEFAGDMMEHMQKEDRVLFPMIRSIERGERPSAGPGKLSMPVSMMMHEHTDAGRSLEHMRELTKGFKPPMDACNTYRALFDGLAEVEQDTHAHVHKENNILFPRRWTRRPRWGLRDDAAVRGPSGAGRPAAQAAEPAT